jgi:hypothetical protein
VVEKKVKNVLNTPLVDQLLLDVKQKAKEKLGEKQNDKIYKFTKRS